jgi:hypothetical protein
MLARKIAAGSLALLLGLGVGACGRDDTSTKDNQGPGQSSKEDPTLGDPNGGGTSDAGTSGTGGQTTDDGADEGNPANGSTDSGSGTGSGRADGTDG